MRLYEDGDFGGNMRQNERVNFVDDNNTNKMVQGLCYNTAYNNNQSMKSSAIYKKRQAFRQQIRRQYLKSYFEKKRIDYFGWPSYNNQQQNTNGYNNVLEQVIQIDSNDYSNNSKDDHNNRQLDDNIDQIYDSSYFKGVILMQRLIMTSEEDQLTQNQRQYSHNDHQYDNSTNPSSPNKINFKYKSFYQFITQTIQQNLHPTYFNSNFTNNNNTSPQTIYTKHINSLKKLIYRQLTQQIDKFLIKCQQYNMEQHKQNLWAYHQMLVQTLYKLIWQVCSFVKSQNLQYANNNNKRIINNNNNVSHNNNNNVSHNNNNNCIKIPIQQQLAFLINILISITYYDQIQQQSQSASIRQSSSQQQQQQHNNKSSSYNNRRSLQLIKKLNQQYLNEQQLDINNGDQHKQQQQRIQITRYIVQETQLIDTIKFIIVFGIANQHQQQYQQQYYKQYYYDDYHNDYDDYDYHNDYHNDYDDYDDYDDYQQYNYQQYHNQSYAYHHINNNNNNHITNEKRRRQRIISLMLVLLRNVSINIGSDLLFQSGLIPQLKCILNQPQFKVQIRRSNHNNHMGNKNTRICNNNNRKSAFHYRIQHFLIQAIQQIRNQQSIQYLSSIDSFQFTFDALQHISQLLKQINTTTTNTQKLQQQTYNHNSNNNQHTHSNNRVLINNQIQLFQSQSNYFQHSQYQQSNQQQQQLRQLINKNKVNKLIQFAQHTIQALLFHFYLGQISISNSNKNHIVNQYNQTYNNSSNNNNQPINETINKFYTKNRYIVKFTYIPNAQSILQHFQKGRSLLNKIPYYQSSSY